jgi:hypothetical protein
MVYDGLWLWHSRQLLSHVTLFFLWPYLETRSGQVSPRMARLGGNVEPHDPLIVDVYGCLWMSLEHTHLVVRGLINCH